MKKQLARAVLAGVLFAGSGIFPHHERSPYNNLNAATHAAETLASIYVALEKIYEVKINIFLQGALRAIRNVISCQNNWKLACTHQKTERQTGKDRFF